MARGVGCVSMPWLGLPRFRLCTCCFPSCAWVGRAVTPASRHRLPTDSLSQRPGYSEGKPPGCTILPASGDWERCWWPLWWPRLWDPGRRCLRFIWPPWRCLADGRQREVPHVQPGRRWRYGFACGTWGGGIPGGSTSPWIRWPGGASPRGWHRAGCPFPLLSFRLISIRLIPKRSPAFVRLESRRSSSIGAGSQGSRDCIGCSCWRRAFK